MQGELAIMRIHLANDHAAGDLRVAVIAWLKERNIEVVDHGTDESSSVDYPDHAHPLASGVVSDDTLGILICGSANGVAMTANKHPEVRVPPSLGGPTSRAWHGSTTTPMCSACPLASSPSLTRWIVSPSSSRPSSKAAATPVASRKKPAHDPSFPPASLPLALALPTLSAQTLLHTEQGVPWSKSITPEDLSNHLHILAADNMEGRETGKLGQQKAAAYIAEHFKTIGLKEVNGSYLQEVPLTMSQFKGGLFSGGEGQFVYKNDWVPYPGIEVSDVEGPAVFAGYGIQDEGWDDYAGLDVKASW